MKKTLIATLLAATAFSPLAFAQHREGREGRQPARGHPVYRTPHVVYDARFHHDHYYPRVGYAVRVLPADRIALSYHGGRFFFHAGVWYAPGPAGFIVARPPVGIVVPVLPPAYTTIYVAGVPYYYANDVYYVQQPAGFVVTQPPPDAQISEAPPPPAAPANAPASGNWFYCESSKTFYPYVSSCPEGWKQVPATPPR